MKHPARFLKSFCLLLAFLLAVPFIYAQDEKEKERKIEELATMSQQARQRGDIAEAIRLCDEEIAMRQAMKHPFYLIGNAVHNQATN